MSKTRKLYFWLSLEGKDIWEYLEPWVLQIAFDDNTKDRTKSKLDITLADHKGRFSCNTDFLKSLWHKKIHAGIAVVDDNQSWTGYSSYSFNFGEFQVLSIHGNYYKTLNIRAISYTKDYKEIRKTRNEHYEKIKLKDFAKILIEKAGFKPVLGEIPDVMYEKIEVKHQSIEDVLGEYAKKYNLKFFIKGDRVIFGRFTGKEYIINVNGDPVKDIEYTIEELSGVSKVIVEYFHPEKQDVIRAIYNTGKDGEIVRHVERVENEKQAMEIAKELAKKLNKRKASVKLRARGFPIYSGSVIELEGLEILRGKWEVERALHRISKSEGWNVELELSPLA